MSFITVLHLMCSQSNRLFKLECVNTDSTLTDVITTRLENIKHRQFTKILFYDVAKMLDDTHHTDSAIKGRLARKCRTIIRHQVGKIILCDYLCDYL